MDKNFIKGAIAGYAAKSLADSGRHNEEKPESNFGGSDSTADLILAGMVFVAALFGLVMFFKAWWSDGFVVGIGVGAVCSVAGFLVLFMILRFFGDVVKTLQYFLEAYQAIRSWLEKR